MVSFMDTETKSIQDVADELKQEKNSLRRFLTGLTATTFGVLVALHPHEFSSDVHGWFYASSVIANAFSVVFFICSLYGRTKGLIEEGTNIEARTIARFQGKEEANEVKSRFPNRFVLYEKLGLALYLIAVAASCTYIILEVIG